MLGLGSSTRSQLVPFPIGSKFSMLAIFNLPPLPFRGLPSIRRNPTVPAIGICVSPIRVLSVI